MSLHRSRLNDREKIQNSALRVERDFKLRTGRGRGPLLWGAVNELTVSGHDEDLATEHCAVDGSQGVISEMERTAIQDRRGRESFSKERLRILILRCASVLVFLPYHNESPDCEAQRQPDADRVNDYAEVRVEPDHRGPAPGQLLLLGSVVPGPDVEVDVEGDVLDHEEHVGDGDP